MPQRFRTSRSILRQPKCFSPSAPALPSNYRVAAAIGMRAGNILTGITGRCVDRPIRPDAGDTCELVCPTQLPEKGRLCRIELSVGIRDHCFHRPEILFQEEITFTA